MQLSAHMTTRDPVEVFLDRLKTLIPWGEARDYAARAGTSEQTLSKWRTGALRPNPKLRTLSRWAAVLRVPIAHLISDDAVFAPAFDPAAVDRLLRAADDELAAARKLRDAVAQATKKP